jgi:hypothetical protein
MQHHSPGVDGGLAPVPRRDLDAAGRRLHRQHPKIDGVPAEAAPFVAAAWVTLRGVFGVILATLSVWALSRAA